MEKRIINVGTAAKFIQSLALRIFAFILCPIGGFLSTSCRDIVIGALIPRVSFLILLRNGIIPGFF